MANLAIRFLMLQQLASADLTVTAIAERIGAVRNSVAKSMEKAHEHGIVHIAGYSKGVPIYRRGAGQDEPRPPAEVLEAPAAKPVPPVVPVLSASLDYFEMDILPNVQHFTCTKLKSTLSVESCADRYKKAMAGGPENDRYIVCRGCPIGASHSGQEAPNESRFFGKTICGRCHTGATRLIGKHLCISCYNRSRELRVGKNRKGTAPVKLTRLDQRSIAYRTAGVVKTRTLSESVDTEELMVAVLRDTPSSVTFGFKNPALHARFDGEQFDRSIGDAETDTVVAPIVPDEAAYVEHVIKPATAGFDPYERLRDVVEKMDHEVRVCAPGVSRRAAKKARLRARRQVRVSDMTVGLLRNVGALPASVPVPVPVWKPSPEALALMQGVIAGG